MRLSILALAAAAAAFASPAAATVAISGTLHSRVEATIADPADTSNSVSQFATQSTSWSGAPNSLVLFNGVTASLGDDFAQARADFLRATWASADAGSVGLNGLGWSLQSSSPRLVNISPRDAVTPDWSYTFTATGDGVIDMRYGLDARGGGTDTGFGLGGWDIGWTGAGGGLHIAAPGLAFAGDPNPPPDVTGDFSRAVSTGQTYTISVANQARLLAGGTYADDTFALLDASFSWEIRTTPPVTGVPEPTSWALMLLGFAGLGGAARRRRATCAA